VGGAMVNLDPRGVPPFGDIHLYGHVTGKADLKLFDIGHCVAIKTFSADDCLALPSLRARC
jgi:hypothetical protein